MQFIAHSLVINRLLLDNEFVMNCPKPHYLLFCDGNFAANGDTNAVSQRGRWRFVLENVGTGEKVEATDSELSSQPDRTALVAVLRGLEALEQPSRVTLVTTSRYVSRGLQYGLTEWRENDFSWEHFGTVQPIRNADLWKRIDRTLAFHLVQCRWMAQGDASDADPTQEATTFERAMSQTATHEKPEYEAIAVGAPETVVAIQQTKTNTETARTAPPSAQRDRARTSVARSTPNRIYVDSSPELCQRTNVETVGFQGTDDSGTSLDNKIIDLTNPIHQPSKLTFSSPMSASSAVGTSPLRWIGQLFSGIWARILAVDACLDSCFRCLLLLEPRIYRPRRS
jgi:ribonuclease HI